MNSKIMIGVIVAVVVLAVGSVAYMKLSKKSNEGAQTAIVVQPTVIAEPTSTPVKSLKDLVTLGATQKCTFKSGEASMSAMGTIYIDSGKVRGDVTTAVTPMHMILDGNTSYIWLGQSKNGFKMSWNAAIGQTPNNSLGFDPNKQMNYDCTIWTPDSSMFTLPSDVKFTDMSKVVIPSISVKGVVLPDIKY